MSYKILTVDDSRMVRMIVARTFLPLGCDVFEATNGTDGLAIATGRSCPTLSFSISRWTI